MMFQAAETGNISTAEDNTKHNGMEEAKTRLNKSSHGNEVKYSNALQQNHFDFSSF